MQNLIKYANLLLHQIDDLYFNKTYMDKLDLLVTQYFPNFTYWFFPFVLLIAFMFWFIFLWWFIKIIDIFSISIDAVKDDKKKKREFEKDIINKKHK